MSFAPFGSRSKNRRICSPVEVWLFVNQASARWESIDAERIFLELRTWGQPFRRVVDDNLKERLEGRVLPTMTANLQDSLRLPDGIPMLRPQDDLKWGFRILTNQLKLPKMQAENFVRLGKRTNQRFLQLGSSLVP